MKRPESDFVALFEDSQQEVAARVYYEWIARNFGRLLVDTPKRKMEECGSDGRLRLNAFVLPRRLESESSTMWGRRRTWMELGKAVAAKPAAYKGAWQIEFIGCRLEREDVEPMRRFVSKENFPALKRIDLRGNSDMDFGCEETVAMVNDWMDRGIEICLSGANKSGLDDLRALVDRVGQKKRHLIK